MNTERDILVCCAYVQPENSNIYKSLDEKNGVEILENTLLELKAEYDDPYALDDLKSSAVFYAYFYRFFVSNQKSLSLKMAEIWPIL